MADTFIHIPAGEGRQLNVLGEVQVFKRTDGECSFFETISQPQSGAPLHIHPRMDEGLYVLEGSFVVQAGDRRLDLGPGDFVHVSRGVAHGYRNAGDRPGRLLFVCTPGGYEKFFEAMAELPAGPPDMGRVIELARRFDVEIVGPLP